MRKLAGMSREELAAVVRAIQEILFQGEEGWGPDKEWDEETIEWVAAVLEDSGLKPEDAVTGD